MTYDTGTTPPLAGTTGTPPTSPPSSGTSSAEQGKQAAKQGAAEVAGSAKEHAGAVAGTAQEQTQRVAGEAKSQAKDVLGQARTEVTDQARQQQQRAAGGLRSLGDELRSMADHGGQGGMAQELAQQAAQRTSGLADWLENREPGQLLDEARGYARRHPGGFLLGAAVAGIVAGRLTRGLKASNDSSTSGNGYSGQTSGYGQGSYGQGRPVGTVVPDEPAPYDVDLSRPEPLPGPAVTDTTLTGTTTGRSDSGERLPSEGPLAGDQATADLRDLPAGGVAGTGTTTGRVTP